MDQQNTDNGGQAASAAGRLDPKKRLKLASLAMASNMKLHAAKSHGDTGTGGTLSSHEAEQLIEDWPAVSKEAVRTMMEYYGPPNEGTASRLFWYQNRPWKRTVVYRDEVPHNFPVPHTDILEQVINYQVPAEAVGEIAKFDKSIFIAQTLGEVSARCDNEGSNVLALNLMHKIVTGELNAEEARDIATEQITAYLMNRPAPLAEDFQFKVPDAPVFDADVTTAQNEAFTQAMDKVKETLGLNDKK